MRTLAVLIAFLAAAVLVTPAQAQDILGLTMRPSADVEGCPNGTADIMSEGDGYVVSVDLSGAAECLSGSEFESAGNYVTWAVDMDGNRHNLGTLSDDLTLEGAAVDYVVAKVYVTAEESADAVNPSADPIFSVTLRNVTEVEAQEDDMDAQDEASEDEEGADEAGDEEDEAASDEAEEEGDMADEDDADSTPEELPTTGSLLRDLLVLAALATVLVLGGLRLRAVRL